MKLRTTQPMPAHIARLTARAAQIDTATGQRLWAVRHCGGAAVARRSILEAAAWGCGTMKTNVRVRFQMSIAGMGDKSLDELLPERWTYQPSFAQLTFIQNIVDPGGNAGLPYGSYDFVSRSSYPVARSLEGGRSVAQLPQEGECRNYQTCVRRAGRRSGRPQAGMCVKSRDEKATDAVINLRVFLCG